MRRKTQLATVIAKGQPTGDTYGCGCAVWAMPGDARRFVPHLVTCPTVATDKRRKWTTRMAGAAVGVALAIITG